MHPNVFSFASKYIVNITSVFIGVNFLALYDQTFILVYIIVLLNDTTI